MNNSKCEIQSHCPYTIHIITIVTTAPTSYERLLSTILSAYNIWEVVILSTTISSVKKIKEAVCVQTYFRSVCCRMHWPITDPVFLLSGTQVGCLAGHFCFTESTGILRQCSEQRTVQTLRFPKPTRGELMGPDVYHPYRMCSRERGTEVGMLRVSEDFQAELFKQVQQETKSSLL